MTQLPQPVRGFPDTEFHARVDRAQRLMAEQGFDVLLFCTEPEVRYFTGYLTQFWQSPTRPWFLLVPRSGKPVAVIPEIGAECMARTWIDDIRTWSSPAESDDGISLLKAAILEFLESGKIGLPMGRETQLRMPLTDFEQLRSELAPHGFSDATQIIRTLRMTKSELEIGKVAFVADAISDVFENLPGFVSVGMSDDQVFRQFKIEALRRGADDVSYLVGATGQDGYGDIISPPAGRKIGDGDVLILDTGSVFDGYFCDFDRNYAFGHASDETKRAYQTVYQATEAGLNAARPGATTTDIYEAMWSVLEAGGALGNEVGRLGHGLGMQLTEWPSHTAFDRTELKAGMVITLEPGMSYAPGKVMVHEENIVIRDGPPQMLSRRAASDLPII